MSEILANLDWSFLTNILYSIIPAMLCLTVHEYSHGYVAYRLGDMTAKYRGRLSLNPIRHIDPIGLIMLVVFRFGWAKPVPVNMRNFKDPKRGMAVCAFAGPMSNLITALIASAVYGFAGYWLCMSAVGWAVLDMLYLIIYMSIALAVFNLLPIPPLDGSKVLFAVIPDTWYNKLMRYERYGMIFLIILMATGMSGSFLSGIIDRLFEIISPVAQLFYDVAEKIA